MNREVELRRLPMADKSVVVLTNLRVYNHKDKGIFGEEKTSIRHEAITSVQIGWRRSEGLLLSGIYHFRPLLLPARLTLSYPKLPGDVQPYPETARELT